METTFQTNCRNGSAFAASNLRARRVRGQSSHTDAPRVGGAESASRTARPPTKERQQANVGTERRRVRLPWLRDLRNPKAKANGAPGTTNIAGPTLWRVRSQQNRSPRFGRADADS